MALAVAFDTCSTCHKHQPVFRQQDCKLEHCAQKLQAHLCGVLLGCGVGHTGRGAHRQEVEEQVAEHEDQRAETDGPQRRRAESANDRCANDAKQLSAKTAVSQFNEVRHVMCLTADQLCFSPMQRQLATCACAAPVSTSSMMASNMMDASAGTATLKMSASNGELTSSPSREPVLPAPPRATASEPLPCALRCLSAASSLNACVAVWDR